MQRVEAERRRGSNILRAVVDEDAILRREVLAAEQDLEDGGSGFSSFSSPETTMSMKWVFRKG